jgi:hypothetical protein
VSEGGLHTNHVPSPSRGLDSSGTTARVGDTRGQAAIAVNGGCKLIPWSGDGVGFPSLLTVAGSS